MFEKVCSTRHKATAFKILNDKPQNYKELVLNSSFSVHSFKQQIGSSP